jgi:hypothetical protein
MPRAAPRIDARLLGALARIDKPGRPIADVHRQLGSAAERLGLPQPSYEQVRVLVHALRARRRGPGVGELLLDIAVQKRPPEAIIELFLP